jgi:hypothetical protein
MNESIIRFVYRCQMVVKKNHAQITTYQTKFHHPHIFIENQLMKIIVFFYVKKKSNNLDE